MTDPESKIESQKSTMQTRILYLFTRTPLHVGAGSSVGAIDQPIQRERHTGFPIIPGTAIKGVFADAWNGALETNGNGQKHRGKSEAAWLFGSDDANAAAAGALQFSEGKLLAFPIRSAKGSFAWITCPLILRRAVRDGVMDEAMLPKTPPSDEQGLFHSPGPLALKTIKDGKEVPQVVLEEYTFTRGEDLPPGLGDALANLLKTDNKEVDPVWKEIACRLVILSDGMMSFFAQNACEVAQHVRISDETGTAEGGALFNQENVPSETLFYSVVHFFAGRGEKFKDKKPSEAVTEFGNKLEAHVFQFGGDASTGLGYCTVVLEGQQAPPRSNL
jgi:CRISPR-associated protein Cmr4